MRRSSILLLFTVGACGGAPAPAARPRSAADSVLAFVQARGVGAALDSMWRDAKAEDRWRLAIATGDSSWLEVARVLRPTADGGPAETLDEALALALPEAPDRVLGILVDPGAHFAESWVCGLPFFEGTPDSTIASHRRRALAALGTIREPSLAAARDRCRQQLATSE